jgi:hypothetical protein
MVSLGETTVVSFSNHNLKQLDVVAGLANQRRSKINFLTDDTDITCTT